MAEIQQAIDLIMDGRQDRNGVIHAVSYKLRDWIMEHAIFNHTMLTHDRNSESTRNTIQQFIERQFSPPAMLVSPTVATGVDFKGSIAEYQIIPKMPFVVVKGSKIMQARCRKKTEDGKPNPHADPSYADYLMVQTLSQALGRIMRAPWDRGETFILDLNFGWVRTRLRHHFPGWVRQLVQPCRTVPVPPPPLCSERRES
jgi:Rad3-related DNA helicase